MRRLLPVLLVLLLAFAPAFASDETVLVHLLSLHPPRSVRLQTSGGGRLRVGSDDVAWRPCIPVRVTAAADGIEVMVGDAPPRRVEAFTARALDMALDGRRLTGSLTLRSADHHTLFAVAAIPLEAYVAGVTAAEALPGAPREALRAQAVAARSYAWALARLDRWRAQPLGPHAPEGYDFCDLTHCQVFRGLTGGDADEAVRATRGQRLWREGRVVAAWYHSTCGGRTVDGREIGADPALRGVIDAPRRGGRAWCAASPHFRWSTDTSRDELRRALETDAHTRPVGPLRGVRVTSREAGGRARTVEIEADTTVASPAADFWQIVGAALGWGRVESTWFAIKPTTRGFHFEGRGLGHGAGMCQYGSVAMARAGHTCEQILTHYYEGTRLR